MELLSSCIIELELSELTNIERLVQVQALYSIPKKRITMTAETENRAIFFRQQGINPFDSFHLVITETGGAYLFLTTDDRLLRAANEIELKMRVANHISWFMEVTNDGR